MGDATALMLCAALAAALAQAPPPAPEKPAPADAAAPARSTLAAPPARAPVAGLAGFESRSRIEYPAQPGRLHDLRAAYVFPDRVRWWIAARDGPTEQRRIRYRFGEHVFAVEPQQSASVEYRAEDENALNAAFEMRRALFLWPDGARWTGAGAERRAALANGDELRARVAGSPARPVELEYVQAHGDFHDSLRAITWRTEGPRAWPAGFEVWTATALAWRETVDAVDVETRFVDSFFVPPDRRGVAGTPVDGVRDLDIPPVCIRRIELPSGTTWDAAIAERARVRAALTKDIPALEDSSTYEVRADGTPSAILLRLARVPERAPEGFVLLPDRLGTATSVRGLTEVTPDAIRKVSARLPTGSAAGKPYVRFAGEKPGSDPVVLVVPVE